MKKKTLLKLLVLPMFALLLNSCKKVVDEFLKQPDLDMRFCNIDKINITGDYPNEWKFSYNMLGNPVSVVKTEAGTGDPNWYFTYDTESRLSQAVGLYTNGNYEMWKRFSYNNKDQIIKDTTWIFGAVMGDNPDPNSWRIFESTYKYDAMGRITKITEKHLNGSDADVVHDYQYNGQGNLVGYAYDNKTNISRTNRVWMFLNRDYSKNNRVAAVNYNTAKLPLNYNTNTPYNFLGSAINHSKITYICP